MEKKGMYNNNKIKTVPCTEISGVMKSPGRSLMLLTGLGSRHLHFNGGKLTSEAISPTTSRATQSHRVKDEETITFVINLGCHDIDRGPKIIDFMAKVEKLITNKVVQGLIGDKTWSSVRSSITLAIDLISPGGGRTTNDTARTSFQGTDQASFMNPILDLGDKSGIVITRAVLLRYRYGCGTVHSDSFCKSENTCAKILFKYGGGNFFIQDQVQGTFKIVTLEATDPDIQVGDLGTVPPKENKKEAKKKRKALNKEDSGNNMVEEHNIDQIKGTGQWTKQVSFL
jgi:hypothetical protein